MEVEITRENSTVWTSVSIILAVRCFRIDFLEGGHFILYQFHHLRWKVCYIGEHAYGSLMTFNSYFSNY